MGPRPMFAVPADAYDRFMGRYSSRLAPRFLAFAAVERAPVLDVGCGPGSLTAELVARFGPAGVAAVDPSETFVPACRARFPGVDVRLAEVEALPFPDARFGGALAQLVFSFVREPDRATAELARVVRDGGVVAACTIEVDGLELLRAFWEAARRVDPSAADDGEALPFRRVEHLLALWERAGFREVETGVVPLEAGYADFEDCWEPLTHGIGSTGRWLAAQPEDRKAALRGALFEVLGRPAGPFKLAGRAIAVRGLA